MGRKELLIKQDKVLLGIYYLTDQGAQLVKAGGVAGRGGSRQILIPYENGTISYLIFSASSQRPLLKPTSLQMVDIRKPAQLTMI